jgi:hypothetical protein
MYPGRSSGAHSITNAQIAMSNSGPDYTTDGRGPLEYFAQADDELNNLINDVMTGNADVLAQQPFDDFSDINWFQPDFNSTMQFAYMQ